MEYRNDIVRLFREEGLSEKRIATELEIPASTVHYWVAREGRPGGRGPRGRPRITDETLDADFYEASRRNPFWSAVDIREELAPHVSADTVRRRLKEKGMKCRVPARKPSLKPIHFTKRLNFVANHIGWSAEDWHQVVFSDEKVFKSDSRCGPYRVYRPARGSDRLDPRYIVPKDNIAGRFTVNLWMGFGGEGRVRVLHRIERGTLNKEYYTERVLPLIEDDLVEHDLLFMHDLSSIHTSHLATHWLAQRNIRVMEDWPPKGPDLNPVENVWGELVRQSRNESRNRDHLWENVLHAFNQLPNDYFTNLVESMPRRVASVLEKRGGFSKY